MSFLEDIVEASEELHIVDDDRENAEDYGNFVYGLVTKSRRLLDIM